MSSSLSSSSSSSKEDDKEELLLLDRGDTLLVSSSPTHSRLLPSRCTVAIQQDATCGRLPFVFSPSNPPVTEVSVHYLQPSSACRVSSQVGGDEHSANEESSLLDESNVVSVRFIAATRAVTPGQSAAFYAGFLQ